VRRREEKRGEERGREEKRGEGTRREEKRREERGREEKKSIHLRMLPKLTDRATQKNSINNCNSYQSY
jgi:hypothetical protein